MIALCLAALCMLAVRIPHEYRSQRRADLLARVAGSDAGPV